jgi:hypothetical protein
VWRVFVTNLRTAARLPAAIRPGADRKSIEARRDEMERRLTLTRRLVPWWKKRATTSANDRRACLTSDSGTEMLCRREAAAPASCPGLQLKAQGRFEEAVREIESIREDDTYFYQLCALGEFKTGSVTTTAPSGRWTRR